MITSYKELPIGKYIDICTICKDEQMTEIDKQVKILSILSDKTEADILHLPIGDYKAMVVQSRFLEEVDNSRHKAARIYNVGKWQLVTTTDYRKLETAQYVDFQTFAPMADTKLPELLSCLLIPIGHRYNEGYDIVELQQDLRDTLSVTDALSMSAFFFKRYKQLIEDSLNSCTKELQRMKGKEKEKMVEQVQQLQTLLRQSGDGFAM